MSKPNAFLATATLLLASAALAAPGLDGEWGEWRKLEGENADRVNSLPDCLMLGARIHCFARSTGAVSVLLWNESPDGGETWAGWVDLGGSLRVGPKCEARGGGRIDCLAPTQPTSPHAGRLARITHDVSGWGEWVHFDDGPPVSQRPSCVTGPGQAMSCFVTTAAGTIPATGEAVTAGELWRVAIDGEGGRTWEEVTVDPLRTSLRPECVGRAAGIDCFVIETVGTAPARVRRLWGRRLEGGAWGGWEWIADNVGEPPHCLVRGVGMDCFSRTGNDAEPGFELVRASYDGRSWSMWDRLGGDVQSQPWCNRMGGGFECFWTSPGGELWRGAGDAPPWPAPQDLDGAIQQRPVCLVQDAAARVDCFARGAGTDTTLHQRSRD